MRQPLNTGIFRLLEYTDQRGLDLDGFQEVNLLLTLRETI
jgi:hypothetical protein